MEKNYLGKRFKIVSGNYMGYAVIDEENDEASCPMFLTLKEAAEAAEEMNKEAEDKGDK